MRVYLDNCALNREFDDQTQSRIRIETEAVQRIRDHIEAGVLQLVWSYVINFEVARNPFQHRRLGAEAWRDLSLVEIGPAVSIVARAVAHQNVGLAEIDSLHVACAVASKSGYFITTDDAILKKRAFD